MISTHRPALRSALPLLALGALALPALGACGPAASASSAKATSPATSPATPSATPSATPTTTAPSTTAAPVAAAPRTATELTSALLGLSDLPTGYSVEKDTGRDSGQPTFSASAAACRDLVSLLNTPAPPGSVADATVGFSGGQDGPFVSEQLSAFPGASGATAVLRSLDAAAGACDKATISMPGSGSAAVTIAQVSPPQAGEHATAFRVTAAAGSALEGFEVTFVATQVGDVTAALTFLGALPDEVDGATQAAVDKVTEKLGAASGSASTT
ncbi:sensor domain-containing protein [Lapillicoccus jejuensis]|uniref:PknH-like protein n=1 Tax=Lapillicoccus jejuensis TaxID=402171 RepID=A0A542E4L6_9MICO|nr:sensor domain-containing protein [Lapillicoccus jejuensis]TQJ10204.1 PknH-like protein [Lapillicoccus jejuensis]